MSASETPEVDDNTRLSAAEALSRRPSRGIATDNQLRRSLREELRRSSAENGGLPRPILRARRGIARQAAGQHNDQEVSMSDEWRARVPMFGCVSTCTHIDETPLRRGQAQVAVVEVEPIEATVAEAEEVVIAVAMNEATHGAAEQLQWDDQSATIVERIMRLETQLSDGPGTGNLQDRLEALEQALGTRSAGSMIARIGR